MLAWITLYTINSLIFKWVLSWGGAEVVKGWLMGIEVGWSASDWNEEQIRLYALCAWIIVSILFVIGLFVPEIREFRFLRRSFHFLI